MNRSHYEEHVILAWVFFLSFWLTNSVLAQVPLPEAKPVPHLQVIPQPDAQVSVEWDGVELTRYHFGIARNRPFLFPINGPAGRSLTRLGNIRDPHGHRHHYSVWIAHHDVNGVNFWTDGGKGRIVHQRAVRFDDGNDMATIEVLNDWIDGSGVPLMEESRRMDFLRLEDRQWLLVIRLQLMPAGEEVMLGKTPFGLMGMRVATSLSVQDGGGIIRNSNHAVNEKEAYGQHAKWIDYSGPVAPQIAEGLTLMDHPQNPGHPVRFHVRDDGWIGASLTIDNAYKIDRKKPLQLCYGLFIHGGVPTYEQLEKQYQQFVTLARSKDGA